MATNEGGDVDGQEEPGQRPESALATEEWTQWMRGAV